MASQYTLSAFASSSHETWFLCCYHSSLKSDSSVRMECLIEGNTSPGTIKTVIDNVNEVVPENTFYIPDTNASSGKLSYLSVLIVESTLYDKIHWKIQMLRSILWANCTKCLLVSCKTSGHGRDNPAQGAHVEVLLIVHCYSYTMYWPNNVMPSHQIAYLNLNF